MAIEHSKWRDGRSYYSSGYNTMKHPTRHNQPQFAEWVEMKRHRMPHQPSSKHYESYIESTKAKQHNNERDTIKGHVGLDVNNIGRSVSNTSERSRWSGDCSYTDRSDHVNNNPWERFNFPYEENATNDANATPHRQQTSYSCRQKLGE